MVDTWFHQQTSAWGGPPTSPNIPDAPSGSAPGDFFAAQSSWRSWRGGHGSCSTQSSRVFCSAVQRSNCSSVSWSQSGISDRWRFLLSNIDKSMARSVNQFTWEKVVQDCISKIVTWSIHKISKPWFNLLGSGTAGSSTAEGCLTRRQRRRVAGLRAELQGPRASEGHRTPRAELPGWTRREAAKAHRTVEMGAAGGKWCMTFLHVTSIYDMMII